MSKGTLPGKKTHLSEGTLPGKKTPAKGSLLEKKHLFKGRWSEKHLSKDR